VFEPTNGANLPRDIRGRISGSRQVGP
jgi:hypothetical protein